ncbi:MAG: M14 family zinc carboxypeptidase [Planctomycetota bacterium]
MLDNTIHARGGLLLVLVAGLLAIGEQGQAERTEAPDALTIDADYPGGNIIVDKVTGDTVHLRQDLRDTRGWWFYWNFRVLGAAGRELTFAFSGRSPIGVRGPAISRDKGKSWQWLGRESVEGNVFTYCFPESEGEVRFAFAMPYHRRHLDRFLKAHAGASETGRLSINTLCQSAQGRDVPLLSLKARSGTPRRRVLVTARHHACETMANYVLEGFIHRWLSEDGPVNPPDDVEVMIVPLVDYDGVEDGDQGKNRKPRDHNRDYDQGGIYPETRAIRTLVESWPARELKVAIDLHCPWIRGKHNEVIYMVGTANERIAAEQARFGKVLQAACQGDLTYQVSDNLPFGTAWNTADNYKQGMSFSRWASERPGIRLATTFEIPYANAGGQPVTPASAHAFGQDLAAALVTYLRHDSS